MKKILVILVLFCVAPTFASCSLTGGACTPSDLHNPSLNEKTTPNNLQLMQRPDHFQQEYQTPFNEMNLNMESGGEEGAVEPGNYNSSCQFGFCIPR
jgi:hypothetical protein